MIGKFFNHLGKKNSGQQPNVTPDYKRFNDAILVVSQDNTQRQLPIKACNERAVKLIGRPEGEISSLDLREILPPETTELLNDYIEFSAKGRSVYEVLHRVPNFRLLSTTGRHVPVKLRIVPGVSDANNPTFRLVMSDASLVDILQEARKNYSVLSPKEFLIRDMQQAINYGRENGHTSCFAVISFIDDNLGSLFIKRAEKMIDSTKRDTDILGLWNENTLVYIMPDTPLANAVIPLQRFQDSMPDDLGSKLVIRYAEINDNADSAAQIKDCLEGKAGTTL